MTLPLILALFAAAPPADPVAPLVLGLGGRSSFERDHAQARLLALGPPVLARLKRELASPDPEVRRRLLRVVAVLEAELDLRPTRITADFKATPLPKVFAALRKSAGTPLVLEAMEAEQMGALRLTATFRDATFWEVMDELCRKCSLRVAGLGGDAEKGEPAFVLVPARRQPAFAVRHGAFRLVMTRISNNRSLDLEDDGPAQGAGLEVDFSLHAEPRLRVVNVGRPVIESAYDDRGRALPQKSDPDGDDEDGPKMGGPPLPPPPPAVVLRDERGGGDTSTAAVLATPSDGARRLRSIKGAIPATVLVGHKTSVLLEKLEKGGKFTAEGQTYTVASVRTRAQLQEVRIKHAGKGGMEEVAFTGLQALEFIDASGRICRHELADANETEVVIQVSPNGRGRGRAYATRLLCKIPLTREIRIPFEFRNVPLP